MNITIRHALRFTDHHPYTAGDLEGIFAQARRYHADAVVTTEKDAMRLLRLRLPSDHTPIFVFKIEMTLTKNEDEFLRRLRGVFSV